MKKNMRVLAIVPYRGLGTVMQNAAEEYPFIELTILNGNLKGAVKVAERHFDRNKYDLIVSRGGTARALREAGFPVVEVEISLYDILCGLKLAKDMSGKIAMVVFAQLAVSAQMLCDLLNYEIEIVTLQSLGDARPTLENFARQQNYTVLCDSVSYGIAQSLGLPSILITSGISSIHRAFTTLMHIHTRTESLWEDQEFFQTLLGEQAGDTVVLDPDGGILFTTFSQEHSELICTLRKDLKSSDLSPRFVRRLRGISYYIDMKKIFYHQKPYTAFCIETRKIPAFPGETGIHLLSSKDLENYAPAGTFAFLDILNLYYKDIHRLSRQKQALLLLGAPGSEAHQLANTLYLQGPFTAAPMVYIDCQALSTKTINFLLESYNSPLTDTKTTIFFANIHVLKRPVRFKLIGYLQELKVCQTNQVIFSSTTGTEQLSQLRIDFIDQLGCSTLSLIPLCDRKEDIPSLVKLALGHLNVEQTRPILDVSPDAIHLLQNYPWPHNYAQFSRVIQELTAIAEHQTITASNVMKVLQKEKDFSSILPATSCKSPITTLDMQQPLAEINKDIAQIVLADCKHNQTTAAKRLGISRTTLWRLLRKD